MKFNLDFVDSHGNVDRQQDNALTVTLVLSGCIWYHITALSRVFLGFLHGKSDRHTQVRSQNPQSQLSYINSRTDKSMFTYRQAAGMKITLSTPPVVFKWAATERGVCADWHNP